MQDAAHLPLVKRLVESHWKVREEAYQTLTKLIKERKDESDPLYEKYGAFLCGMLRDVNAAAQLAGLETVKVFAEIAPLVQCRKHGDEVGKALAEKVLIGRPLNRQQGMEVFLAFVGAGASMEITKVFCATGFSHKTPKVVVATVMAVTEAIETYGSLVVPGGPLLEALPTLLEHQCADVRNSAKALAAELQRWIGVSIESSLRKLKPVTRKELEAAFRKNVADGKPSAKKLTRDAQQNAPLAVDDVAVSSSDSADVAAALVEPDLRLPIDLPAKISSTMIQVEDDEYSWAQAVECAKWNVRKEALDALVKVLDGRQISSDTDIQCIASHIRRILAKDLNVNVVSAAANSVRALATAQRGNSMQENTAKGFCAELLKRLKEKNPSTRDAIFNALTSLIENQVLDLSIAVEDIETAAKNKLPYARAQLFQWLRSCRESPTCRPRFQSTLREFSLLAVQCSDDASVDVRDASLRFLAALIVSMPARDVETYTSRLHKKRQEKVMEYIREYHSAAKSTDLERIPSSPREDDKAVAAEVTADHIPAAGGNGGEENAVPDSSKNALDSCAKENVEDAKGREGRSSDGSPSRTAEDSSKVSSAKEISETTMTSAVAVAEQFLAEEEEKEEEISSLEACFAELIGSTELLKALLGSSAKGRVAVAKELEGVLRTKGRLNTREVRCVLWALESGTGLRDNHADAFSAKATVFCTALKLSQGPFGREVLRVGVDALVARLGDLKCSREAHSALVAVAEETSAAYVAEGCKRASLTNGVGPRILAGACSLVSALIVEFGSRNVPSSMGEVVACQALSADAPALRGAGASLAALMEVLYGTNAVREKLNSDEKVINAIGRALEKMKSTRETWDVAPIRKSRAWFKKSSSRSPPRRERVMSPDKVAPDCLSPATRDRSVRLRLLSSLQDKDWSVRAKVVEELAKEPLENAIQGGDDAFIVQLFLELKKLLSDPNRNIAATAMLAMARWVPQRPPAALSCGSQIVSLVARSLGDVKASVREGAALCLTKWLVVLGPSAIVQAISPQLRNDNSPTRRESLEWLLSTFELMEETTPDDVRLMLCDTLMCVEDKAQEVRLLAEKLIEKMKDRVGVDCLSEIVHSNVQNVQDSAASRAVLNKHGILVVKQELPAVPESNLVRNRGWTGTKRSSARTPPKTEIAVDYILPREEKIAGDIAALPTPVRNQFSLNGDLAPSSAVKAARLAAAVQTPMRSKTLSEIIAEPTPVVIRHRQKPAGHRDNKGGGTRDESATVSRIRNMLVSSEADERINGCKVLNQTLSSSDPSTQLQTFALISSELVNALAVALQNVFLYRREGGGREVKYYVNGLLQFFSRKALAGSINRPALSLVMAEALERMADTTIADLEGGPNIVKAYNVLMLRMLENSPRSELYHVLLRWLGNATGRLENREEPSATSKKSTELAVKCVMKLGKEGFAIDHLPSLLRDIHVFMALHPRSRLPSRLGPEALLPMRCVKSLLGELVAVFGSDISSFLSQVPVEKNPIILGYISSLLKAKETKAMSDRQATQMEENIQK